jgi:dicarboxylate transporter 10
MAREMKRAFGQKQLSSSETIMCAGLAGGAAGLLGNPTEVVIQSGRQIEFC